MLKRLRLPALVIGTALALMSSATVLAERHHDEFHARHERREVQRHFYRHYYVAPVYPYGYGRHRYAYGYYDSWGYWHPYRW